MASASSDSSTPSSSRIDPRSVIADGPTWITRSQLRYFAFESARRPSASSMRPIRYSFTGASTPNSGFGTIKSGSPSKAFMSERVHPRLRSAACVIGLCRRIASTTAGCVSASTTFCAL